MIPKSIFIRLYNQLKSGVDAITLKTRSTDIFNRVANREEEGERMDKREKERERQELYAWLDKFDRCRAFDSDWAEIYSVTGFNASLAS